MVPNLKDYSYTTSLNPLDKVSKRAFLALQWSVLGVGVWGRRAAPPPNPHPQHALSSGSEMSCA